MKYIGLIILVGIAAYGTNGYKLSGCDFKSNYTCEVVHVLGAVVPPASLVTVWFGTDED